MPVFEFKQKEVTVHTIVVRAESEEEAAEYVGGLGDDEFAESDTDWLETRCKKVSEDTYADTDLTEC